MPRESKSRVIGNVTSVSSDKIVVELQRGTDNFTVVGFDDMHYVAQLGSYLLIPVQSEYVVGEVIGLWEKDPNSVKPNEVATNILDKARSAKFVELAPIGMLRENSKPAFIFGVSVFPPLYAEAIYARESDLDRIFQVDEELEKTKLKNSSGVEHEGSIATTLEVGHSVIFKGYPVKVKINEYFGGHVAVLGNTGSGKSCTIAAISQSLFDRKEEFLARGASFIFFDVNGEYRQAFENLPEGIGQLHIVADHFNPIDETKDLSTSLEIAAFVGTSDEGVAASSDTKRNKIEFQLPHWFMNFEEWELLLRASEKTQRPVLQNALGLTSLFADTTSVELDGAKNHILATSITGIMTGDLSPASKADQIRSILSVYQSTKIQLSAISPMIAVSYGEMSDAEDVIKFVNPFILEGFTLPPYRNQPFSFNSLNHALDLAIYYEEAHGNRQIRDYCSQMVTRLKSVAEKEEFEFLRVAPPHGEEVAQTPDGFVEDILGIKRIGENIGKDTQLTIIDLNSAADEVVELASAVIARLVFDRMRKAEPRNCYPVHFVLEEAHRYIANKPSRYAIDAGQIFERISKEGRKYGVFLTVSSQRPSELSRTVLSQCNNFVVHRIQNPDDLSHIRQMTPFISEAVLKRLPSLPKQHALIFGNSVNIPTTFKVRKADPRPKSDDAEITKLWYQPKDFKPEWK